MFFAIITELAAKSDLRRVPHALVWSDYYRFPINMVFAVYLLETATLVLSGWAICTLFIIPTVEFWYERPAPPWGICSFSKTKWQMPDKYPKGDVHAWNWLSHTSVSCIGLSSQVKQIRRSNSDRAAGVEKTRLIKHSMVTDTQARRIVTVSNIDQVIFVLIMLTHCFFPATIQLAKCNVLMTGDTIDLAKPLSNKILYFVRPSCASFNPLDI